MLLQREAGDKGAGRPFPLHPKSPPKLLRFAAEHFPLTKPNTSGTIITPASLRSDCCSPSLRNAVRVPSGNDVHLYRNTQSGQPKYTHSFKRYFYLDLIALNCLRSLGINIDSLFIPLRH